MSHKIQGTHSTQPGNRCTWHWRLPDYLLIVSSNYLEDKKLLVETEEGTIKVEISAGRPKARSKTPQYGTWNTTGF